MRQQVPPRSLPDCVCAATWTSRLCRAQRVRELHRLPFAPSKKYRARFRPSVPTSRPSVVATSAKTVAMRVPRDAGKFEFQFLSQCTRNCWPVFGQRGECADCAAELKHEKPSCARSRACAMAIDRVQPSRSFQAESYRACLLQPGATGEQSRSVSFGDTSERVGQRCKFANHYIERVAQVAERDRCQWRPGWWRPNVQIPQPFHRI